MLKEFIAFVKKFAFNLFSQWEAPCKIEHIDITHRTVDISCIGVETSVKMGLKDIALDKVLIQNMPPSHAAWLGFCFSNLYFNEECLYPMDSRADNGEPQTIEATSKYDILCLERSGRIRFLDKDRKITFYRLPEELIFDRKMIHHFSSPQAFYLGYLGGINKVKILKKSGVKTPRLMLVK